MIKQYLLSQHFRCHVLRTTTVGISYFIFINFRFGKTKICNLDLAVKIEQNVFEFDIPEQNIIGVQIFKSVEDLSHDISGLSLWQPFDFLKIGVKVSVGAIFKSKDNVSLGLERVEKINQVIMFNCKEDVLFVLKHLGLFDGGYCVLPDKLQRTILVVKFAFSQKYLRETSTAQKLDDFEITELQTIIADSFLEHGRNQGEFLDGVVSKCLEGGLSLLVDELSKVVTEGCGFKASSSEVVIFALFNELKDMFFEFCMN